MNVHTRLLLFVLFFLSGFCSLLYQIVWLRLAFAAFGVITPVVSVLLSVFMLGLALGSWLGGRGVLAWTRKSGWSPMVFYGLAEGWIAVGSLVVPRLFQAGTTWLLGAGGMDSVSYLLLSALIMAMSILPWCVCMGATVPLVLAYIQLGGRRTSTWFSYLYLANVLGPVAGTSLTAVVL